MNNIRKLISDAEACWGGDKLSPKMCHYIQTIIDNEGIYNNRNFCEFAKGYVFASIDLGKRINDLEEENRILKKNMPKSIMRRLKHQLKEEK